MDRKEIWSWSLYDFANSAYGSIVPVLLFPLFYKAVILNNSSNADLWWGITVGISVLLAGLIAPIVGAFSDINRKRKTSFILFTITAIIGTFLLATTGMVSPILASIIFILTNMSFGIALGLYDSLLSHVSKKETLGKISGLGYAMGYVGAIIGTLLVYPLLKQGVGSPEFWISFIIIGVFYFIFSIPSFCFIKENEFDHEKVEKSKIYTSSFRSVISTIKNWRDNKHILLFLLAFYFLTEGIVTLTYFISLYAATTLKITTTQIAIVFIITQFVSIPSTIILGRYSDKIGYRKVIISSLFIFTIATILLSFAKTLTMVYLVAILIGLVLGVAQSNSRAWFTKIIPEEKRSELFGFNALASKISATIGPPLFGLISVATGKLRLAMISIIIYFVIALILFYKAKE